MPEGTFWLWDTDSNGLIDALEIFSVLALYSKALAEDWAWFIFRLFDFNGNETMDSLEIFFLISQLSQGICKMHQIEVEPELYTTIETIIRESFPKEMEASYMDMY